MNERTNEEKKSHRKIPSATSKKKNDCFDKACDIDVRACAFTQCEMVEFSLTVGVEKSKQEIDGAGRREFTTAKDAAPRTWIYETNKKDKKKLN